MPYLSTITMKKHPSDNYKLELIYIIDLYPDVSMDLKVMSRSQIYILCIVDEVTDYLITITIHQSRSEEIGVALIENVITKYCVPDYIIMDQDCTFTSSLMNYLFKKLDIKLKQ